MLQPIVRCGVRVVCLLYHFFDDNITYGTLLSYFINLITYYLLAYVSEHSSPRSPNRAAATVTEFEEQLRNAATNIKEKQGEIRLLEEKLYASSKLVKSLKNAETKYLLEIESLKVRSVFVCPMYIRIIRIIRT